MVPLKEYVADTVAWAGYLADSLPKRADRAFAEAERREARVVLPEIALGEFLYLALRDRLEGADAEAAVRESLFLLRAAEHFRVEGLRMDDWDRFLDVPRKELHDRMIAAMALGRSVPLITGDAEMGSIEGLTVLWR